MKGSNFFFGLFIFLSLTVFLVIVRQPHEMTPAIASGIGGMALAHSISMRFELSEFKEKLQSSTEKETP